MKKVLRRIHGPERSEVAEGLTVFVLYQTLIGKQNQGGQDMERDILQAWRELERRTFYSENLKGKHNFRDLKVNGRTKNLMLT
jgi:hypothetical protein